MDYLENMRKFWRGKNVLVTGHTGFKGSWLCLWLELLDARVAGYALSPPTQPSLFELCEVRQGIHSVHGDVRDLDGLTAVFRQFGCEIVIHMAAQSLVRASYGDPVGTYGTNVMGTVNVLEAARGAGTVRAVVNVTSDKCYENDGAVRGCCERDPMGGWDPYSSSKGCAELVTAAYRRSFFDGPGDGAAVASARAGNVLGGGDWATDRLVPDFIRAIQEGKPFAIRNPSAVRPWQHVLEPLSGYLLLAERLYSQGRQWAEGWNFGPDEADALPVSEIADRLVRLWGADASWVHDGRPGPHEARYLRLDCSKAKARLGWRPRMNVDQALAWVVQWHQGFQAGRKPRSLCLEQIQGYMGLEAAAHG